MPDRHFPGFIRANEGILTTFQPRSEICLIQLLKVTTAQHSVAGIKPVNQDACGIQVPDDTARTAKGIAAVIADGMSGSDAGKEASEACVKGFLHDYFSTPDSWSVETSGAKVLSALNRWLYAQSHQIYESPQGMVTTLSALVIKSSTAYIFHVGDTRIYRLRDGEIEQLTRDHRVYVSEEKNFLSRALGIELHMEIDYRVVPVQTGDVFLLTTDGIHDFIETSYLLSQLSAVSNDWEAVCHNLVQHALKGGSNDNLSCQVIHLTQVASDDERDFYRQLTELPFPPYLDAGLVLDGYRILREIHASKRTQVYLAADESTNEKVILKTPSLNYEDDPEYIDAFLHEEWAGRRVNSPHVLKLKEPHPHRQCLYYVCEYVEGQTLRQWMHDNPLPALMDVRNIVEQIAAGLRVFHRLEMIHQDLKPENIMIDSDGTVKIIDYGSIKIAGIEEISVPVKRDNLLGTRNYTAPEYLKGLAGTNRSDLFSLGIIAYELLTGKLPYNRELTTRNLNRVRYQSASAINPDVPVWLDGALEKACAINPQRRYGLLSEFLYDLSHPNPVFTNKDLSPLIERNPVGFWRGLALSLFLINLLLLFYLMQ